jgi:hypothetical protein
MRRDGFAAKEKRMTGGGWTETDDGPLFHLFLLEEAYTP